MSFFDIFPTPAEAPYSYAIVPVILVCSIIGFYNKRFFHRHLLHPYEVWRGKRWYTLVTSALIHRNWLHMLFNTMVIYGLGYDMFGNIEQELGTITAHLLTPLSFLLLIVLPNLIQTRLKRNDFVFTAVGASGLSSGLFGFSFIIFPLQKINHLILPIIQYAGQYWLYALLVMVFFSFFKISRINTRLHISAYLLGSIIAFAIRSESLLEFLNSNGFTF